MRVAFALEIEEVEMRFLTGSSGQSMVEWLVIAVILVAVVGGVLIALFTTLSGKLQGINDAL